MATVPTISVFPSSSFKNLRLFSLDSVNYHGQVPGSGSAVLNPGFRTLDHESFSQWESDYASLLTAASLTFTIAGTPVAGTYAAFITISSGSGGTTAIPVTLPGTLAGAAAAIVAAVNLLVTSVTAANVAGAITLTSTIAGLGGNNTTAFLTLGTSGVTISGSSIGTSAATATPLSGGAGQLIPLDTFPIVVNSKPMLGNGAPSNVISCYNGIPLVNPPVVGAVGVAAPTSAILGAVAASGRMYE